MTFILAIECFDGFVMCSDTLEVDGYTRRYVQKMRILNVGGTNWGLVMGGAGESGIIDGFWDRLSESEFVRTDTFERADVENKIETAYRVWRERHANADVQFIFGLFSANGESQIYRTERECLAPKTEYCMTGLDMTLPLCVLRSSYRRPIALDDAVDLGVFVTGLMKEYGDGVGGDIQVLIQRRGSGCAQFLPPQLVKRKEQHFSVASFQTALWEFWQTRKKSML